MYTKQKSSTEKADAAKSEQERICKYFNAAQLVSPLGWESRDI